MPEAAIAKEFIGEAGEPGQEYTSGSQRADLMRYIELNTRARGENATSAVRGVEMLGILKRDGRAVGVRCRIADAYSHPQILERPAAGPEV